MQYISMVAGRSKWTLANGDPMCPPPIKMSSFKRPVVSCTTCLKSDWVSGGACKPHFSFNDLQDGSQTGWQTSRGHKGRIFVDKKGEFSWTLLVNSHGHFGWILVGIFGEFLWTFFGWILLDIFCEFSWTLF